MRISMINNSTIVLKKEFFLKFYFYTFDEQA